MCLHVADGIFTTDLRGLKFVQFWSTSGNLQVETTAANCQSNFESAISKLCLVVLFIPPTRFDGVIFLLCTNCKWPISCSPNPPVQTKDRIQGRSPNARAVVTTVYTPYL